MQGYNIIMLYSQTADRLLMCRRKKEPYKGLNNLIGGKIEPGESGLDAAYRELFEEANVQKCDAALLRVMDFTYYISSCYVEVYAGRLNKEVQVSGDENELYWTHLDHDFFDMKVFAGEGNIGHMIEQVKLHAGEIFSAK